MNSKTASLTALVLLLFPLTVCSAERVRKPVFAGSWYPGEKKALETAVKGYLNDAVTQPPAVEVKGLICPHAGYVYSGQVAAYSYRSVAGRNYDVIVLIGPSHRYLLQGSSVYSTGRWECPTGSLKIDETVAKSIIRFHESIRDIEAAHAMEHSLELQLPFIIGVFGDVPIVPIVLGDQSLENVEIVAGAIVSALKGKNGLIIASSDLSHFHDSETANRLDALLIEKVRAMDVSGFITALASGSIEACGGGPIAVMLTAAKKMGADSVDILKHANSGEITGDKSNVVGYLAAAVYRTGEKSSDGTGKNESRESIGSDEISKEVQEYLHGVAREAIVSVLENREPSYEKDDSPVLDERRGAFVTLKIEGRLRGCIGQLIPTGRLIDIVKSMAAAAAFRDWRFEPLTKSELEHVEIEISVLTPLRRVNSPREVEVGRHGVYIIRGDHSGVLLPQVAPEQGWNREQLLEGTCRKAGLPLDSWKDKDTQIYIFSAQIF